MSTIVKNSILCFVIKTVFLVSSCENNVLIKENVVSAKNNC